MRRENNGGHVWATCDRECLGCHYCNGGLAFCTICKGGEVELSTDCPGRVTTDEERKEISDGQLDYRAGAWVASGGKP